MLCAMLWCDAVVRCCGVMLCAMLWCGAVVWCCGVVLWCDAVVCCCGVMLWCGAHRRAPLQQDIAVVCAQLEGDGGVAEGELDTEHLQPLRLDRGAEEAEVVHLVLVAARVEEGL